MGRCTFSLDNIVITPPNDIRSYRLIELENGLTALLVHDPEIYPEGPPEQAEEELKEEDEGGEDGEAEEHREGEVEENGVGDEDDEQPEGGDGELRRKRKGKGGASQTKRKGKGDASQTKKAAAAMSIGIGSFSDPIEAQGLAHFLEHMLFMGSTEFPDENEYDSYLSKHGGSSNAYTEAEHTCYHFEVKWEFLKGALRRFSQFFVSPLVKIEAMEREVQAVDSEFNQVLQNESCRLEQFHCHTAAPGHPFNKFFWGNKKSLVDAMENGINLRERILKLYRDYYHGGLMKLVVIGGESLDILEDWVVELFSNVKKGPQEKLQFKAEGPIWKAGKLYRLEPVRDFHMLYLTWTLPCLHQEYLKKPEDYLAHLLGHEGRGSLHFYLKARGWATYLAAGAGSGCIYQTSVAYVFNMTIRLTDSGLEKMFDVIGIVYQYIKLLRQVSPQEWIFRELQDIGNMEFKFSEEPAQDSYASGLAGSLLFYPAKYIIYGGYAYETWDEELIKHVLGFFTPDNMRVDLVSKSSIKSEDFQCEPWFGSKYTEEDISPSLMDLWKDPLEIDVSLHLPSKNEFIPCDFSIRSDNSCHDDPANIYSPRCIIDEPLMNLWYKLDTTFKLPRVNTYFRISLKGGYANLRNSILMELYGRLLRDELNEIIYQALLANLEAYVGPVGEKLEIKVCGFNDKLPALLSKILATVKQILPTDDCLKTFYDPDDKLHVLDELSISDLNLFIPELWSQVFIEGLCHGNIDASVKNKLETNSVTEEVLTRMNGVIDLLIEIIREPLFNQLRTKEQLGYIVECGPRITYRVFGFIFYVQSSEYSPVYLQERIDNFINGLEELLEGIDDDLFENYRSGLMAGLLEKDLSLTCETDRYWCEIVGKRYMFDFAAEEAEELKTIHKEDVINWYRTYLQQSSPKCRRLATRVWGCNTDPKEAEARSESMQGIEDPATFKMSSTFYPSLF
ncbi:nardilysin-like [Prunus yedoensis var. nudiflora]|uniref:Nardilysin-like n=1 Tax=Prunus yedoensis var. nudiflora TaxID=2094558 RepID=A0A314UZY3_PRUYE|nr:nardilysin-like [Prunus yedoensis var. nudiflora]